MPDINPTAEGSSAVPLSTPGSPPPIRTMKDDLVASPPAPVPAPGLGRPATGLDINAAPKSPLTTSAQPTPPAPAAGPPQPRKKRAGAVVAVIIVLLVISAGAAGAWWYFMSGDQLASSDNVLTSPTPSVSSPWQLIPANTSLVIHYNLSQPAFRERLIRAWQTQPSTTPLVSLLGGNPGVLLEKTDITELFYVTLPNDPRSYLLIPKTISSEQIIAQQTEEQVKELDGWYVLHPLSVATYNTALSRGQLSAAIDSSQLSTDYPLHVVASGTLLADSHPNVGVLYPSLRSEDRLILNGQVSASGHVALLTNDTQLAGSASQSPIAGSPGSDLYQYAPSDATFIWQGQNFNQDIKILAQERNLIVDHEVLQKLPVNTFIERLSGQYLYYERAGDDGIKDLGLVITLPPTVQDEPSALALGDNDLENTIQALIPRVTGQTAGSTLAFNDGIYNSIALRFVNLVGPTQALDYALHDNKLIIATSKEGIQRLVDTASGDAANIGASSKWEALIADSARTSQRPIQVLTSVSNPLFEKLLPLGAITAPVIVQGNLDSASPLRFDVALGWAEFLSPSSSPSPSSIPFVSSTIPLSSPASPAN